MTNSCSRKLSKMLKCNCQETFWEHSRNQFFGYTESSASPCVLFPAVSLPKFLRGGIVLSPYAAFRLDVVLPRKPSLSLRLMEKQPASINYGSSVYDEGHSAGLEVDQSTIIECRNVHTKPCSSLGAWDYIGAADRYNKDDIWRPL